jgi:hypothetical protein
MRRRGISAPQQTESWKRRAEEGLSSGPRAEGRSSHRDYLSEGTGGEEEEQEEEVWQHSLLHFHSLPVELPEEEEGVAPGWTGSEDEVQGC